MLFVSLAKYNMLEHEVELLKKDIIILKQGHLQLMENDIAIKKQIDEPKKKNEQYFG